ncbi:hypothetical protein [Oharaeibacter diazotrophicus]|uniref:hypothetical protein n=1 Tax=Oharaeibacter diazotrophicus TaxID=1920512 RepID=UPI000F8197C8|nr:hypothetical protein [Oharaeibacter diazotrophicus]GLS75929.1 hypothetical protein GCM10007904_12640 [Oharaeibacter diazotrophicus]
MSELVTYTGRLALVVLIRTSLERLGTLIFHGVLVTMVTNLIYDFDKITKQISRSSKRGNSSLYRLVHYLSSRITDENNGTGDDKDFRMNAPQAEVLYTSLILEHQGNEKFTVADLVLVISLRDKRAASFSRIYDAIGGLVRSGYIVGLAQFAESNRGRPSRQYQLTEHGRAAATALAYLACADHAASRRQQSIAHAALEEQQGDDGGCASA